MERFLATLPKTPPGCGLRPYPGYAVRVARVGAAHPGPGPHRPADPARRLRSWRPATVPRLESRTAASIFPSPYSAPRNSLTLRGMTAEPTDEDLMLAYAKGDVRAFETLYGRHRAPLYRFVQRGLVRRALADECFQDIWGRVVAARERYRPEAKFSTWLYQIAHNLLVDQYRRARPEVQVAENEDGELHEFPDPDGKEPERELSEFEERRQVQLALQELPEEQRVALQLRLEQELPLEEIARITGVGRETVKSRLRYALDKLKSRLRP
jgi:RNA polymerase sigma-70 factor (ECF subfamily)